MKVFQIVLAILFLTIFSYTLYVGVTLSWNFFDPFLNGILAYNWFGQFNLDFLGYLILSAIWVSWRHHFSAKGLLLALLGLIFGLIFITLYLLYFSIKLKGDIRVLLLGESRAYQN